MQTGKMLDQMTALLPYLAPLVEDDEIMALRNEIKDKKSAMDAHEAVMRMFPLVVTKHRNELYGILGVLLGRPDEEIAEMDFSEVKAALSGSAFEAFFDFFPFVLRVGMC